MTSWFVWTLLMRAAGRACSGWAWMQAATILGGNGTCRASCADYRCKRPACGTANSAGSQRDALASSSLPLEDVGTEVQHELREEEIRNQDEDRRGHHGLRRRPAHALRPSAHGQALITPYRGENETEDQGLRHALDNVGELK